MGGRIGRPRPMCRPVRIVAAKSRNVHLPRPVSEIGGQVRGEAHAPRSRPGGVGRCDTDYPRSLRKLRWCRQLHLFRVPGQHATHVWLGAVRPHLPRRMAVVASRHGDEVLAARNDVGGRGSHAARRHRIERATSMPRVRAMWAWQCAAASNERRIVVDSARFIGSAPSLGGCGSNARSGSSESRVDELRAKRRHLHQRIARAHACDQHARLRPAGVDQRCAGRHPAHPVSARLATASRRLIRSSSRSRLRYGPAPDRRGPANRCRCGSDRSCRAGSRALHADSGDGAVMRGGRSRSALGQVAQPSARHQRLQIGIAG